MAKTFKWRIERDVDTTNTYRVIEAQFGDGYKQTSTEGINTTNLEYALKLHAYENTAKEIMAFFNEHAGWKSFFWTPPLGELGLYTCTNPKPSAEGGGLWSISATFVKSYSAPN